MKLTRKEEEKQRKVIAKLLTVHGYRNSPIEDIHAGRWPKDKNGEFAKNKDVIVTTKDGTSIPWNECSRINDTEMKHLNKTIHNNIYTLLTMLNKGIPKEALWWFYSGGEDWDEPELTEWYKKMK